MPDQSPRTFHFTIDRHAIRNKRYTQAVSPPLNVPLQNKTRPGFRSTCSFRQCPIHHRSLHLKLIFLRQNLQVSPPQNVLEFSPWSQNRLTCDRQFFFNQPGLPFPRTLDVSKNHVAAQVHVLRTIVPWGLGADACQLRFFCPGNLAFNLSSQSQSIESKVLLDVLLQLVKTALNIHLSLGHRSTAIDRQKWGFARDKLKRGLASKLNHGCTDF